MDLPNQGVEIETQDGVVGVRRRGMDGMNDPFDGDVLAVKLAGGGPLPHSREAGGRKRRAPHHGEPGRYHDGRKIAGVG